MNSGRAYSRCVKHCAGLQAGFSLMNQLTHNLAGCIWLWLWFFDVVMMMAEVKA